MEPPVCFVHPCQGKKVKTGKAESEREGGRDRGGGEGEEGVGQTGEEGWDRRGEKEGK